MTGGDLADDLMLCSMFPGRELSVFRYYLSVQQVMYNEFSHAYKK